MVGLHDIASAALGGVAVGGVLLGAVWLWILPRVQQITKEEVRGCRRGREVAVSLEFQVLSSRVMTKLDSLSEDVKYVKKRLDSHMDGRPDVHT